ncbi:PREDICTED: glutathione S-transferase T3-like [Brassica oleracea var. oleracea]|uniref:glutathione S-transferase T3-like n=1 Tax=Brassica oleracea var. oleracea TaxID=109376 RepID=UPI0006A7216E|nr:PREDICTED: glutathione S-transferase T3-like [Brassica oleracea var. oleracea]
MAMKLSSMAMKLTLGGDRALSQWLSSNRRIHGARERNLKAEECKAGQYSFVEDSVQLFSSSQVPVFGSQGAEASSCPQDTTAEHREHRMWTPVEDMVVISSWLNTSKDPVVGNEQRSGAFWNRIAAYFAASPKVAATEHRESTHCKQRWHKINDQVNKFCGAFEAATREKTSGQNENDLRNDQKWCAIATSKNEGSAKRRKLDEGSQSETSHAHETMTEEECPPNVKAAKGKKKKNVEGKETLSQFQTMWEIKQKDLVSKDRLSRMRILDRLLAKQLR